MEQRARGRQFNSHNWISYWTCSVFEVIRAHVVCFNKGIKYCVRIQSYRYIFPLNPSATCIPAEAFVSSEFYSDSANTCTQSSGSRSETITHPTATAATTTLSPDSSTWPSLADISPNICGHWIEEPSANSLFPVLNLWMPVRMKAVLRKSRFNVGGFHSKIHDRFAASDSS